MKVSKNQVVWARCHLIGLASGMACRFWSSGPRSATSRSVASRTARKAASSASASSASGETVLKSGGVAVRDARGVLVAVIRLVAVRALRHPTTRGNCGEGHASRRRACVGSQFETEIRRRLNDVLTDACVIIAPGTQRIDYIWRTHL